VNIAVLGLGRMGRALAGRLIGGGHQVTVWNRTAGRAGDLIARGATESQSVSDAVHGADIVVVSLSGDDAVRAVLVPDGKPVPELGGVVVDCSTVAPSTAREEADAYPGRFVACPIAGAPQAVESGSALLIVGGPTQTIDRAAAALDAVSSSRAVAGEDPGSAAIIKLLNNYLLLGGLAALADAIAIAQASGFADADLRELLGSLPVVAPALKNRIDGLIGGHHDPWFTVELGSKDLSLFADFASHVGVQAGLADAIQSRYRAAAGLGLGERDLTAVIEVLRREGAPQ
jgi:3-hydroxyisobutyrate dehydrogenase-like beta-hydroxyacid dehydrogenase